VRIESNSFQPDQRIPTRHTRAGSDVSPELHWSDVPDEARQLVLVCDDPDAPRQQPWVHWVMYDIAPSEHELPEGVSKRRRTDRPAGAHQGPNSWGDVGYAGPQPPRGNGTHHYRFHLYAVDIEPGRLPEDLDKEDLLDRIDGHVCDEAELVGTYERI
jgi:hypothetical protein